MKKIILSSLVFCTLLNTNLISNAERLRDDSRPFNSRENLKNTFSIGAGMPGLLHVKYSNMFDNKFSGGFSLGALPPLGGISASLDLRYYISDLSYNNSIYTETSLAYIYTNNNLSNTFAPNQKFGFEYRGDGGFTFNISGGIGIYMSGFGANPAASIDLLLGYSF
jgi:hypothetical protein